jgi:uncharacterized protein (TIGR02421 family)
VAAAEYLRRISDAIVAAQRPIRLLRALNWDPAVHERFFRHGARELPQPSYAPLGFDAGAKLRELKGLRRRIRGRNPVEDLLRKKCDEFADLVRLLSARGTRRFYELSRDVFGDPRDRFPTDKSVDNLAIARLWAARPRARHEEASVSSADAVGIIKAVLAPTLGTHVRVYERARLTANAAAGATSVAIRKGATFTPRQVRALAHHEGLWHVLTSLNGFAQPVLTVLGVGLPRFTESQEGAGIVAEFLSGNVTNDRFIELGERTIAVDMAARGADYLEVYRYLLSRFSPQKSAQMAERIFRGGVLTGGAPFTKDAVYQRGYCRCFNFIRTAVEQRDLELVRAFLSGKMGVDDAEMVRDLVTDGLCVGPRHLPDWFADIDRLNATVTHSVTMNRFSLERISRYYARRRMRQDVLSALGTWGSDQAGDSEELPFPRGRGLEGDVGE